MFSFGLKRSVFCSDRIRPPEAYQHPTIQKPLTPSFSLSPIFKGKGKPQALVTGLSRTLNIKRRRLVSFIGSQLLLSHIILVPVIDIQYRPLMTFLLSAVRHMMHMLTLNCSQLPSTNLTFPQIT